MMTRKFSTILAAIASLLFASVIGPWTASCSAAMIIGTPVTLSSLLDMEPGETFTVGDKIFSGFGYTFSGEMPAPTLVNVVPIQDDDGNFGIRFQGGFMDLASSQGASDALITYMVEAGPGFLISDAHLAGNPNVMGELGAINVTETFLPLGQQGQYTLEIYDDENLETAQLMDAVDFVPPVKKLNVQKNILAFAVPEGQSVTLSMVDQTFSQVVIPEPSTVVSLMMGVIAIALARRQR
jgi:hypothetical protein